MDFLEVFSEFLKIEVKQVFTAISAREGLKIFEKHLIDIIISDYSMPHMDGAEFLDHIQSSSRREPLFYFSTGDIEVLPKKYKIFQKPFNIPEVLLQIKDDLRSRE